MLFNSHRKMISIVNQHLWINRILLLAIGLWPYQRSLLVRFQQILLSGILTSSIIFQLTAFITTKCTPKFIIKVSSCAMIAGLYVIYYTSFWLNAHNVKYLLEEFQNICNELKDENEIAIIEKYGNRAKHFTVIITSLTMCGTILVLLLLWPHNHDTLHKKEFQPHQTMQIVTEFFVDKEKYYYLILLYTNIAFCIGVITFVATGLMLIGYSLYACGLYRIASYRIKQAMTIKVLEHIHLKNQTMICKEIIAAIEIHRKAIDLSEFLSSSFEGFGFLIIMISIICLSLNIFGMFQNASLENKQAFSLHILFVFTMYACMFVLNYAGQEVTDYNNHIYSTAYNSQWYRAPLHAQKLILFMLQRGSKSVNFSFGGLIVPSLECFVMIVKTSMSYFTVMYSIQE